MRIQISSGKGPLECELAVAKFYAVLQNECPDCSLVHSVKGREKETFQSVCLETEQDLSCLDGTVLWKCKSPYRPHHKRKNWYIDVSILREDEPECRQEQDSCMESQVRFETFRSGKKGGQHVNKVEIGVRVIHIPTGISVESTSERSQYRNKQIALERLWEILAEAERTHRQSQKQLEWIEKINLTRGNPVRIYEGTDFKRVDNIH